MIHIIYKTVNTLNNKYYIGVHTLKEGEPLYLGSGVLLKKAIEKYGKEKFSRETLYSFSTREEALSKEKEMVTEDEVKNPRSYNIALGGQGGTLGMKQCHTIEAREKHTAYMKSKGQPSWLMTKEARDKANRAMALSKSHTWYRYDIWGTYVDSYLNLENAKKGSGVNSKTVIQKITDKCNIWLKIKGDDLALSIAKERLAFSPIILLNKETLKLDHYWYNTSRLKNDVGKNSREYVKEIKDKYVCIIRMFSSSTTSRKTYTASNPIDYVSLENRDKAVEMDSTLTGEDIV